MAVGDVKRGRWFLPETPDVRGVLRRQLAATIEGADALRDWSAGDPAGAERVRAAEDAGEAHKRELLEALRAAFVLPLEPEDLFTLSRAVDRILNSCRDLVDEAKAMGVGPDAGILEMADSLDAALRRIDDAFAALGSDPDAATAAAEAALADERRLARAYYRGTPALLEIEEQRERIGRRELYRRFFGIGEVVAEVAERVIYAVVKQT